MVLLPMLLRLVSGTYPYCTGSIEMHRGMGRTRIPVDERRRKVLDARLLSFPCAKRRLAAKFGTAGSSLIQEQSFHPILRPLCR
jgi:hypothetical protein